METTVGCIGVAKVQNRFPQKTAITAPSKPQLEDALLVEILSQGNKLPPAIRDLFVWHPGKGRIEFRPRPEEPEMIEVLRKRLSTRDRIGTVQ